MSGINYRQHFAAHLRLTVLLVLCEASGYSANSSVLHSSVEGLGLAATRDQLRAELAWLEEQGLIALEHPSPSMSVARLTERGQDAAQGRATVPGVQRPAPKV